MDSKSKCTAIVLAAGKGKRMNSSIEKQFLEIKGYPVLYYSLKCFQKSEIIDNIILVTGKNNIEYCKTNIVDRYHFSKVSKIVAGGKERYHSVYEGLRMCKDADYVFIHDGARPFVTDFIIENGFKQVKEKKACVVAVRSKDTVKITDDIQRVKNTPNRNNVWIVQTPQIFEYQLIADAYESILKKDVENMNITDDAMVVEQETGANIFMVEGNYQNIKITTPEDIQIANAFLDIK